MKFINLLYTKGNKISDYIWVVLRIVLAIILFTCALDLLYQVLYRFIIVKITTISSPFTEEYARYAMIWCCFLALPHCYKAADMPALNFFIDLVSGWKKKALFFVTRALVAVFLVIGIKYGYLTILNNLNYVSPVLKVPGAYLYSAPLVSFIMISYELVIECLGVICGAIEPFAGRVKKTSEEVEVA